MDSMAEIFMERANNEFLSAQSLKKLTEEPKLKEMFELPADITFYSAVISHSYYAIFYAAKAILLTKGIKTFPPKIHKNTFEKFKKHFVDTGVLDVKLLEIYKKMVVRADELLEIFREEKRKRGNFTYNTIPQANKEPAEDSLKNAKTFISNIRQVIRKTEKGKNG
jgi:uncharacterized protein (UPF0332 family)